MRSRDGKNWKPTQNANKTWRVRFIDESNARRSVTLPTKNEVEALQRAIRRREPLDQWFPSDNGSLGLDIRTFNDLADKFLENRDASEISESCVSNYRTQLKYHILPILGSIDLRDLKLQDIERLAAKLKKTKPLTQSYKTVRKTLNDADEFLSSAYRREILTLVCVIAKFGYERD